MLNEVIDQNLGIDVIKRVFTKIGFSSEPVLLGAGNYGLAYTYAGSDKVYKLTEDVSEAAEAMKISGFNNKHLANVYGVYELQYDALKRRMFLIILEKLKTDAAKLTPPFKKLMDLAHENSEHFDIVSLMNLYGRNKNVYEKEAKKFLQALNNYPEEQKLYNGLLGIASDLARHHIKSTDYHPHNLGYKEDGNLAFFDMGFSDSNIHSHSLPSIELEERIFERIMTFMPNAKAMAIKKKCQINGNGDGTSEDCNQGDIDNIILKEIKDVINESLRNLEPEDYKSIDDNRLNGLIDKVISYKFTNNDGTVKYVTPEETDDFNYYINSAYYNQERFNNVLKNKNSTIFHNNLNKMYKYIKDASFDPKKVNELNAFHGTPNKFDAFSMDMVGSSDGREVGGWGLYFSDDQGVATQYSTKSGGVMHVELPNGKYLNFDDVVDDQLAQEILSDESIPENQREQFQSDFYDESYRYDTTNKQVYEWLSAIFGNNKEASKYLLKAGFVGNMFKDKTNPEATNYVLFDTRRLKKLGYVGNNTDDMNEYLGYVQEMVKFELMKLNESRWDKLVQRKWEEFTQGDKSNDFSIKEKEEILRAEKIINVSDKDVDELTDSVMKSLLNENQQMQPNSGFDLKTMDNLRSFSKRKQYADQTLQKIGSGSARIVYQMLDGNVLKLAKNEKGLGQNDVECGLGQDHYFSDIITQVKDCDSNDLWVVSEKANKIAPKRFKELTGVTPEELSTYIANTLSKSTWHSLSPERKKEMGNIDFVNHMTELAHSYNLEAGDLGRINSYGEVNRDGQPEVVLIDYGFTTEVMKQYYSKPKERNIWEGYFDEVDIHDMVIDELHGIIGEHGTAKTDINNNYMSLTELEKIINTF